MALTIAGVTGLLAPWVPFYELHQDTEVIPIAFIDFLDLSILGFSQPVFLQDAGVLESLPILLPFLILPLQIRRLFARSHGTIQGGRPALVVALLWVVYFAAVALWRLPVQVIQFWSLHELQPSAWAPVRQAIRMIGLFGSIGVGVWLLKRRWLRALDNDAADHAVYAMMIVYLVAVVPELVSDAVSILSPEFADRPLAGYGLLLWTCVVYAVALRVRPAV
jgi:hypothetical protein